MPTDKVPLSGPENVPQATMGDKIKNFIQSMMSDPGLSPMGLGVVAGSPGANAMVQALTEGKAPSNAAEAAIKFAQLKYPTLMKRVMPIATKLDPMTAGAWNRYPKAVGMALKLVGMDETGPMLINSAPTADVAAGDTLGNVLSKMDTVGHEVTHGAIQATRTPEMVGDNYIRPTGPGGFQAYFNQPAEVNARQGGATASKTLLNFLSQYPELHKFFGIGQ